MYTYLNFSNNFAGFFNIDASIFDLDLAKENLICEYNDYEEYDTHQMDNKYFSSYQCKQNKKENWQSICFQINLKNKFEVLNILNNELSKVNQDIICMDDALDQLRMYSEYEFHYFEGDNLLINGLISDEESYISISRQINDVNITSVQKHDTKAMVA